MASPARDNSLLQVKSHKRDQTTIVQATGDVDLTGSPTLRMELRKAAGEKPVRLVIDLSEVGYMDSSGVATLVEAMQITRKGNTKLVLCGLQSRVRSVFEIARLDSIFTIVPSLDEAIQ